MVQERLSTETKRRQSLLTSAAKRLGYLLIRALAWIAARVIALLPMRTVQRIGDAVGWLAAAIFRRRCKMAEENVAASLQPPPDCEQCRRIVLSSCHNMARSMLELFKLARMKPEDIMALVTIDGQEHLRQAAERGHGVIVVTAHFGNWELLGAVVRLLGFRLAALARDASDGPTARMINAARAAVGIEVLGRDELRRMLTVLRTGGVLGVLCDQHQARGGEVLDFLSRPAATAMGPALLSLRTGAPIVPGFARRLPDGRFHVYFYPPIPAPQGDRRKAARQMMQRVNDIIGAEIRNCPDQWLWLHRRWRREILEGSRATRTT